MIHPHPLLISQVSAHPELERFLHLFLPISSYLCAPACSASSAFEKTFHTSAVDVEGKRWKSVEKKFLKSAFHSFFHNCLHIRLVDILLKIIFHFFTFFPKTFSFVPPGQFPQTYFYTFFYYNTFFIQKQPCQLLFSPESKKNPHYS